MNEKNKKNNEQMTTGQSKSDEENQKSEVEELEKQKPEIEPEQLEEEEENVEIQGSIQAEISRITESSINFAGKDIINIEKIVAVLNNDVRELNSVRQIRSLAPLDASSQKAINEWFVNPQTSDRDKFFAITLGIFNGLKYPDFRSVYEFTLRVLNVIEDKEEQRSRFRFEVGDDELMESLGVEIIRSNNGLEEIIRFKNEGYVTAIFDLIRRRYRSISLDLLFVLKQIVEKYHYWEIRFHAAIAIAEIGKIGFYQVCNQVLEPWACDKRDYVRAAVGYPLALMAIDKIYRSDIEKLLIEWSDKHMKEARRYRWTVASTCKQIGLIDEDWAKTLAFKRLKEVAGYEDAAGAVTHTLIVLSLQGQLQDILSIFKNWVQKADDEEDAILIKRYNIIILTLLFLSEVFIAVADEHKETDQIEDDTKNLFHLLLAGKSNSSEVWQLVVLVGVQAFEFNQFRQFFGLIMRWSNYSIHHEVWIDILGDILVDVFLKVQEPRHRELIWKTLGRWQQQRRDENITRLASLTKVKIKKQVL